MHVYHCYYVDPLSLSAGSKTLLAEVRQDTPMTDSEVKTVVKRGFPLNLKGDPIIAATEMKVIEVKDANLKEVETKKAAGELKKEDGTFETFDSWKSKLEVVYPEKFQGVK